MELKETLKLTKAKPRHRPEVSCKTGFSSATTHYAEASIDLHKALVTNQDATYFVRVEGSCMENIHIYDQDVLLVDRSLPPKNGKLAVVVKDGGFIIIEINTKVLGEEYTLWGVITYIIHKT